MCNRLMIFVVDDEVEIAHIVADILRDEGYDVECMYDALSVLLAIRSQVPDLVILDNMMPLMSGLEVLHTLRAEGFQQPVMLMSAVGQAQRFVQDGASAFLPKPFTIDALLLAVEQQLGSSETT